MKATMITKRKPYELLKNDTKCIRLYLLCMERKNKL